jgi:hypothetical protein
MKVSINQRPYAGPWGGGNRFIAALTRALKQSQHSVVHSLEDRDVDIILLIDPRTRSPNVTFGAGAVLRYLTLRNPSAFVVHRINECDERKGEPFINHKLVRANYVADATVFVGEWLTRLPVWRRHLRSPWFVIRNGSDRSVFNSAGFRPWSGEGPIKLVTHHWGYHPLKGFDIYRALDELLAQPEWRDRVAFTYVGQLPKRFTFKNARYVEPLDGEALAAELRSHHTYLTASVNEPGGNHQNEGALCGLPLLYRNSGCMPEYCEGFGVSFSGADDFVPALTRLQSEYFLLLARMPGFPHTAERMTREWLDLLTSLVEDRTAVAGRRQLLRDPWAALATQIPV